MIKFVIVGFLMTLMILVGGSYLSEKDGYGNHISFSPFSKVVLLMLVGVSLLTISLGLMEERSDNATQCQNLLTEECALQKELQSGDLYIKPLLNDRVVAYNTAVTEGKNKSEGLWDSICYDKAKWQALKLIDPDAIIEDLQKRPKDTLQESSKAAVSKQQFSCKAGDVVYLFSNMEERILPYTIESISVGTDGVAQMECFWYDRGEPKESIRIIADDLGKTAFSTREDAEVALPQ